MARRVQSGSLAIQLRHKWLVNRPRAGSINTCAASGGTGYTTPPALQISGGGPGVNALLAATVNGSGGLSGCTIISPGTGFTSNPSVAVLGGTSLAIRGVLDLSGATVIQPTALCSSVLSGNNIFTGSNTFGGATNLNGTTLACSINGTLIA